MFTILSPGSLKWYSVEANCPRFPGWPLAHVLSSAAQCGSSVNRERQWEAQGPRRGSGCLQSGLDTGSAGDLGPVLRVSVSSSVK